MKKFIVVYTADNGNKNVIQFDTYEQAYTHATFCKFDDACVFTNVWYTEKE